jgi:hypothetical protein
VNTKNYNFFQTAALKAFLQLGPLIDDGEK